MISPPYPADLEAKGWALDYDYEKIEQSDTWAIATTEQRPWLLMIWLMAWRQAPIASLPNNDRLIAARIGMPVERFIEWRDMLLSGFELATDGRLYHKTLTAHVLRMASKRDKDRARVAAWRARSSVTTSDTAASNADERQSNALHTHKSQPSNTNVRVSTAPSPTPSPTPKEQRVLSRETQATQAMIAAGLVPTKTNPLDPRLIAAIEEGATPAMFAAMVPFVPQNATRPMAWVVAAVRGQLAEAKAGVAAPKQRPRAGPKVNSVEDAMEAARKMFEDDDAPPLQATVVGESGE